jgi:hypothetical protein
VRLLLALAVALALAGVAWAGREHFARSCDASSAPGYARRLAELNNARLPTLLTMQRGVASGLANGMGAAAASDLRRLGSASARLADALADIDVPDYKREQRDAAVLAARRVAARARTAALAVSERSFGEWRTAERGLSDATSDYDSAMSVLVSTRKGCPTTPQQVR